MQQYHQPGGCIIPSNPPQFPDQLQDTLILPAEVVGGPPKRTAAATQHTDATASDLSACQQWEAANVDADIEDFEWGDLQAVMSDQPLLYSTGSLSGSSASKGQGCGAAATKDSALSDRVAFNFELESVALDEELDVAGSPRSNSILSEDTDYSSDDLTCRLSDPAFIQQSVAAQSNATSYLARCRHVVLLCLGGGFKPDVETGLCLPLPLMLLLLPVRSINTALTDCISAVAKQHQMQHRSSVSSQNCLGAQRMQHGGQKTDSLVWQLCCWRACCSY